MNIAELIISHLNGALTQEKKQQFNDWLHQSYTHESMIERLKKMKENGHDFSEINQLEPSKAWQKIQSSEGNSEE
jgi:flagellin-specific chaperone FliS